MKLFIQVLQYFPEFWYSKTLFSLSLIILIKCNRMQKNPGVDSLLSLYKSSVILEVLNIIYIYNLFLLQSHQDQSQQKMSNNCYVQNCSQFCCNIDGICPTPFGSYYQQNCYYYYNGYIWTFWWIYFVIVVGSLLCLSIIIACIVACCRRRRLQSETIVISGGMNTPSYNGYGGYPNGNAYELQVNQPVMGQPVYLANNANSPLVYQQDNIYRV